MNQDNLNALAHEIAYSAARSDIECLTAMECRFSQQGHWWDTSTRDETDAPWVDKAQTYLDATGHLERKPDAPHIVRILDRNESSILANAS